MTRSEVIKETLNYFRDNPEEFVDAIEELDGWNGYLGDDRTYPMEDLDELYYRGKAVEVLQRAFFGRDDDTWTVDGAGDKVYGAFNPMRDYFYFNGYGNLVSTDYKDYEDHLDEWFVEEYLNCVEHCWCSVTPELEELLEKYEEAENESN